MREEREKACGTAHGRLSVTLPFSRGPRVSLIRSFQHSVDVPLFLRGALEPVSRVFAGGKRYAELKQFAQRFAEIIETPIRIFGIELDPRSEAFVMHEGHVGWEHHQRFSSDILVLRLSVPLAPGIQKLAQVVAGIKLIGRENTCQVHFSSSRSL